jgi:hypothetical protein
MDDAAWPHCHNFILVPTLCVGTPHLTLCVNYVVAACSESTITGMSAGNFASFRALGR